MPEATDATFVSPVGYRDEIARICGLRWQSLNSADMTSAAWAYYFFSVQFRENLEIALQLHPNDIKLQCLVAEECETDNLSPWPGVARSGERMNHDEYMRRTLDLQSIEAGRATSLKVIGWSYLADIRRLDAVSRALSIPSYEDGGLERVFRAILRQPRWDNPLLLSFKHFLEEHIRFDSDPDQGHGALSRHMTPDDRVLPVWRSFRMLLVTSVPQLLDPGVE